MVPRGALSDFSTWEDVVQRISSARRIVVVAGAGISVSCGIPDFRSINGIYNTMQCEEIGLPSPELLFDLQYFLLDPEPFYRYAHVLLPPDVQPSPTHQFVRDIEQHGKLLRMYTQNIDQLEQKAGISRLVECHGNMNEFKCSKCRYKCHLDSVAQNIRNRTVPTCPSCENILKPGITFFGEGLPREFDRTWQRDQAEVDLVLVMGTSLKVASMMKILATVPAHVPLVLINKDRVPLPRGSIAERFDVELLGACDDVVRLLSQELHWAAHDPSIGASVCVTQAEQRIYTVTGSSVSVTAASEAEQNKGEEGKGEYGPQRKRTKACGEVGVVQCGLCQVVFDHRTPKQWFECNECVQRLLLCSSCYSRGRNAHTLEYGHKFTGKRPHSDFIEF